MEDSHWKGKIRVQGDRRAKNEGHLHLRTVTAGTLWCQKYTKGVGTRASASSPRCPGAASEPPGESVPHGAGQAALSSSGCCLVSASRSRRRWCPGDCTWRYSHGILNAIPLHLLPWGYQCARGSFFGRKSLCLKVFFFFPAAFLFFYAISRQLRSNSTTPRCSLCA